MPLDKATSIVLQQIRSRLVHLNGDTQYAGEKSISHQVDFERKFFEYIDDCANHLIMHYGSDTDEAWDFIVDLCGYLAEQAMMPPFPTDISTEADMVRWLHAAHASKFREILREEARRISDERENDADDRAREARRIYRNRSEHPYPIKGGSF